MSNPIIFNPLARVVDVRWQWVVNNVADNPLDKLIDAELDTGFSPFAFSTNREAGIYSFSAPSDSSDEHVTKSFTDWFEAYLKVVLQEPFVSGGLKAVISSAAAAQQETISRGLAKIALDVQLSNSEIASLSSTLKLSHYEIEKKLACYLEFYDALR